MSSKKDILLEALRSRRAYCEQLNQVRKVQQLDKATSALESHRADVKKAVQLARYVPAEITEEIFEFLEQVMKGERRVEHDPPTAAELARAAKAASTPPKKYIPRPGSAPEAILLAMHVHLRDPARARETMVKDWSSFEVVT